ncbi:MAG TPA: PQQ-binding-like beta-propeller repeat protein [Bryobacteraceae bacterium]|nr:PQQ-binding-like beta-propeller repeat protein [Bryobacteraceae bacterium]
MSPKSVVFLALLSCAIAHAQFGRGGGDWLAGGGDAQRSGSVRTDAHLSADSVEHGIMQSLWKLKLNGTPTPPVVASRLITYKGFKDLIFVSTSTDTVYSIDHPYPRIFWENHIPYNSLLTQVKNGTANCPAGMTASLSLAAPLTAPVPGAGRGGRGGPGGPGMAGPGRGAMAQPAPVPTMPRPKRTPATVYALSSDGLIHVLNQHTGEDIAPAARFIRANAKVRDLISVGNVVYAGTADNCGGVLNGVWSVDLSDNMLYEYKTGDVSVIGMAFSQDGTLFATTSEGLLALEQKTLKLKQQGPGEFITAPLVFKIDDKEFVAAGNVHGHVLVLDSAMNLVGNVNAGTGKLGSAFATWEEVPTGCPPEGCHEGMKIVTTRWLLAPKGNAIQAFKVSASGALELAWTSRELVSPAPPIIVNGVVFALSSGSRTAPAVLYALNIANGKELWSSGKTIVGYSTTGLSAGQSKIYVGTHDGTLYAFGYTLPRE